jgi:hypothetical protein
MAYDSHLSPFLRLRVDDEKYNKNRCWCVGLLISEQRFAQWQHPVASSKALDLLHWAMHMVRYSRIAMVIGTTSNQQSSCIFSLSFVCLSPWRPPGQYGASSYLISRGDNDKNVIF